VRGSARRRDDRECIGDVTWNIVGSHRVVGSSERDGPTDDAAGGVRGDTGEVGAGGIGLVEDIWAHVRGPVRRRDGDVVEIRGERLRDGEIAGEVAIRRTGNRTGETGKRIGADAIGGGCSDRNVGARPRERHGLLRAGDAALIVGDDHIGGARTDIRGSKRDEDAARVARCEIRWGDRAIGGLQEIASIGAGNSDTGDEERKGAITGDGDGLRRTGCRDDLTSEGKTGWLNVGGGGAGYGGIYGEQQGFRLGVVGAVGDFDGKGKGGVGVGSAGSAGNYAGGRKRREVGRERAGSDGPSVGWYAANGLETERVGGANSSIREGERGDGESVAGNGAEDFTDAIVVGVGDKQIAVGIGSDGFGIGELSAVGGTAVTRET